MFANFLRRSPPDQPIPFHHELAQTPNPPAYIFFYCDVEPESGGETPIIDSTAVYRHTAEHHPAFLQKLVTHGARYTRTLPAEDDPSSPIGRSYKNTWHVSTREQVDAKLAAQKGVEWHWLEDGSVRFTTEAVPAIRLVGKHCQNLVFQYVFANSIVAAYLGWQDSRNDRFKALAFGNGDKMPSEVLEDIAQFMEKNRVVVPWRKGDMYVLRWFCMCVCRMRLTVLRLTHTPRMFLFYTQLGIEQPTGHAQPQSFFRASSRFGVHLGSSQAVVATGQWSLTRKPPRNLSWRLGTK